MKYAVFDPSTGRVINWIDTSLRDYKLPAPEMLHECSEVEWERRELEQPQAVVNGVVADFDTDIDLAANKRAERDRLLAESDRTQLPDAPFDAAAWAIYRQALRDFPDQEGFPHLELPQPPA